MKLVIDWVWNGPWWAPLAGALYLAVFISIALGPILGGMAGAGETVIRRIIRCHPIPCSIFI